MAWPASPTTRITQELTSNKFCATVKTHKNVHFHGRACFRPEFEPPNCDLWSKVLTLLVVVAWWQTQPLGFNPTLSYLCCHCVICIESGVKWQFEHCPFQLWSKILLLLDERVIVQGKWVGMMWTRNHTVSTWAAVLFLKRKQDDSEINSSQGRRKQQQKVGRWNIQLNKLNRKYM